MKNNVSKFDYCFGCGLCSKSCGKKAISIDYDKEGFLKPFVNNERCVECGLCLEICSFNHNDISLPQMPLLESYASWSKLQDVRRISSSGGTAFELAKQAINKKIAVVGVRYNPQKYRAEHVVAYDEDALAEMAGSKYIQSFAVDAWSEIRKNEKYFVIGTPCQIDSFRRYIKKFNIEENFILLDFFCHGVPSHYLWLSYCTEIEHKIGKLTYVSWRNKSSGWHDSWAIAASSLPYGAPRDWLKDFSIRKDEKEQFVNVKFSNNNIFYQYFLRHYCLGRHCHKDCRFKLQNSAADFRVGDLWGSTYKKEDRGVSGLLVLSENGKKFLSGCSNIYLKKELLSVVEEAQMTNNARANLFREVAIKWLKFGLSLNVFFYMTYPFYKIFCKIVKYKK